MERPLVNDSADENQVRAATARKKIQDDQDKSDLKFLLNTPQGLRAIWRIIGKCGIYEQSFTGGSETFFKEGKRAIGLEIFREVMAADSQSSINFTKLLNKQKDNN